MLIPVKVGLTKNPPQPEPATSKHTTVIPAARPIEIVLLRFTVFTSIENSTGKGRRAIPMAKPGFLWLGAGLVLQMCGWHRRLPKMQVKSR